MVILAQRFQLAFHMAQSRRAGFQIHRGTIGLGLQPQLIGLRFCPFEKPKLVLAQGCITLQMVIALRDLCLLFEFFEVGMELTQNIVDPRQILPGIGKPVFRLPPTLLVFGDASGLFQKQAQLLRPALDDAADRALSDDGVGARTQASTQKHILDIAPPNRLVVDVVAAGSVACQHPLDSNFGELAPLSAGAVVAVVKHQLNAGSAGRLAVGGSIEDDVLHGLTAQLRRLGLAQNPAYGVHDVGLAAAVRPHDTDQPPWQHEIGWLGKGLEAGELDRVETHRERSARPLRWAKSLISKDLQRAEVAPGRANMIPRPRPISCGASVSILFIATSDLFPMGIACFHYFFCWRSPVADDHHGGGR